MAKSAFLLINSILLQRYEEEMFARKINNYAFLI